MRHEKKIMKIIKKIDSYRSLILFLWKIGRGRSRNRSSRPEYKDDTVRQILCRS